MAPGSRGSFAGRSVVVVAAAIVAISLPAPSAFARACALDGSFGDNGVVATDLVPGNSLQQISDVAIAPTGDIIAVGASQAGFVGGFQGIIAASAARGD